MFFPLSLALPGNALLLTAGGVAAAGLLRFRWEAPQEAGEGWPAVRQYPLGARMMLALAVLVWLQFALHNSRISYQWDGYQIWATKARVLYERGGLTPDLLVPRDPLIESIPNCCDGTARVTAYPHALPLLEALYSKVRGSFDWDAVKTIFPLLFLSLLISLYEAARVFVSRTAALGACVLLGLVPAISAGQNLGGYADMPQAMFVAGALAALCATAGWRGPSYRHPAPWMLGGMLLVKSEGAILFAIACAAIVAVWGAEGIRWLPQTAARYCGAIVVAAICAVLRLDYLRWADAPDLTYGPLDRTHFALAWSRLAEIPAVCAHYMMDWGEWGIFWPVFFLSVPVVFWKGGGRARAVAGATLIAVAAYTSIFYFTNWDFRLHIEQSYSRLLCHLAPAAALSMAVAYRYIAEGRVFETASPRSDVFAPAPVLTPAVAWAAVALVALLTVNLFGGFGPARGANAHASGGPAMTIPAGAPLAGFLDQVNGASLVMAPAGSVVTVTGWAGCRKDAMPVTKVEVLVDHRTAAEASLSRPRPDVAAAYARPDFADSGWKATFAAAEIGRGPHQLTARATCSDGRAATLPPFQLIVR